MGEGLRAVSLLKKTAKTVERAAKLGKIARAARAASSASDAESRHKARRALAALLADARGVPMKVGQVLASGEAEDPFRELVTGVEPMDLETSRRVLEAEWGRSVDEVLQNLEPAVVAASLGQAHPATLQSGERVAIKVQYPGITDAVAAELRLVGLIPGVGPVKKWGFEIDAYRRVLHDNMVRELDYRVEAKQQTCFARDSAVAGVVVPKVFPELSTRAVLVQSWEEGVPFPSVLSWSRAERLHIGRILLELLFRSVFVAGLVHGDPHVGNYRFRGGSHPQVILYDYGCVVHVPEAARLALLKLILWQREGGQLDPLEAFAAMGFDSKKLEPISDALPELAEALFLPFLSDAAFKSEDWRLGTRIERVLGELRWWFRSAGPPELFLLMRAFHGLFLYLEKLGIALPWWPLVKRSVPKELLDRARAFEPPHLPRVRVRPSRARAKLLRVEIHSETAAHEEPTTLAMPAREALELREVIPDDVQRRIEASGTDLSALQARVRQTELAPQLLFHHHSGGKHYRVWLE